MEDCLAKHTIEVAWETKIISAASPVAPSLLVFGGLGPESPGPQMWAVKRDPKNLLPQRWRVWERLVGKPLVVKKPKAP